MYLLTYRKLDKENILLCVDKNNIHPQICRYTSIILLYSPKNHLINEWHFNLKWHWSKWYPKGILCTQKYIRMTWLINNSLFTILRYLKNPLLFINVLLRIYILHIISTPTSITTKTKDIAQQLVKKFYLVVIFHHANATNLACTKLRDKEFYLFPNILRSMIP